MLSKHSIGEKKLKVGDGTDQGRISLSGHQKVAEQSAFQRQYQFSAGFSVKPWGHAEGKGEKRGT